MTTLSHQFTKSVVRCVALFGVSLTLVACNLNDLNPFSEPPKPVVIKPAPAPKPQGPQRPSIERLPESVAQAISGQDSPAFSAIQAIKQLQFGTLDKFDPYYHRAQQYLLLELQIQQLISEVVVYHGQPQNSLRYTLEPLKVDLPILPFGKRGTHIVNELLQDQLALYLVEKDTTEQATDDLFNIHITPKLSMRMGKICLQLISKEDKQELLTPSMALPITDYFFYDYLDGIRQ